MQLSTLRTQGIIDFRDKYYIRDKTRAIPNHFSWITNDPMGVGDACIQCTRPLPYWWHTKCFNVISVIIKASVLKACLVVCKYKYMSHWCSRLFLDSLLKSLKLRFSWNNKLWNLTTTWGRLMQIIPQKEYQHNNRTSCNNCISCWFPNASCWFPNAQYCNKKILHECPFVLKTWQENATRIFDE